MVTTAWFSVGRLDMTVLPLERASLVLEAVPSAADVERIRRFTAAHPNVQWTEAEQFVIDLAGIERAEEKLTVMVHTATFDDTMNTINEQLDAYANAAKLVQESEQLRLILQTILALLNHLNGSTMAEKVVGGFCTSQLAELDEGNQRVQLELEQLDFEHPVLAVRLGEMRRRLEEMADKLVRVK
ncbi:hypothetical protein ANCDUO_19153, partial [Ancylostoma duodenale]